MDRDYHTKRSKLDGERQIPYDIAYTQNLKKKKKKTITVIQSRNKVTDGVNKFMVTKEERGGE